MAKELTGYDISRAWFDFCFENPDLITPNHSALLFFAMEQCNRLGWKHKFGLPTTMAKEAIGIRSYNTYINTLNDLVGFGFIKLLEKSKNQYSSNIIALSKNNNSLNNALDKAFIKHGTKQSESTGESTGESIYSIDKPLTNNKEPLTSGKEKSLPDDVIEYFNISDFQKKINEWIMYRKQIKKPLQQMTKDRLPEEILKMANGDEKNAIEIINRSITNGWQGLFKLTDNRIPASNFERLNNM